MDIGTGTLFQNATSNNLESQNHFLLVTLIILTEILGIIQLF